MSTMSKELSMTTEGHIAALEHRQIDDLMVSALKRKKLEVKDELARFQSVERH
jgi:hypothetical protein